MIQHVLQMFELIVVTRTFFVFFDCFLMSFSVSVCPLCGRPLKRTVLLLIGPESFTRSLRVGERQGGTRRSGPLRAGDVGMAATVSKGRLGNHEVCPVGPFP